MKLFVLSLYLINYVVFNEIDGLILNDNSVKIENYFITSTLITSNFKYDRANRTRRDSFSKNDNCTELRLNLNDKLLKLCLIQDNNIHEDVSKNCTVIIEMENERKIYKIDDINITHAGGYVIGKPYTSSIIGYIEKSRFFGKINIDYKCYYVEKINKFPSLLNKYRLNETTEDAIVYERSIVYDEKEFKNRKFSQYGNEIFYSRNSKYINNDDNNKLKTSVNVKNKLCTLLVVIDYSFLNILAGRNLRESISIVLHNIQEANSLFRSTDFDGDGIPDNIGFLVKYIVIIESENSNVKNQLPKYSKKSIDGNLYLKLLSHNRMLRNVCLGVAFTGQMFKDNVIGLSYTPLINNNGVTKYPGGICETQPIYGEYQNCLVVTYTSQPRGELLPRIITELSLSHELGHSFGAEHDAKQCHGYIMTSTTFQKLTYKNFLFSKCSKEKMTVILKYKSYCMYDTNEPFCGNGILENGEECDCGYPMYCLQYDKCCSPRGTKRSCKLNRYAGYECHPSQGLCCTSECKYRDLTRLGINCWNFNQNSICTRSTTINKCEYLPKCITELCKTNECNRIGLKECPCPTSGNPFCGTCCSDNVNKQCVSAIRITKTLLRKNQTLFNQLYGKFKNQRNNTNVQIRSDYETREAICINNNCISLTFRTFKKNDYCLYDRRIGMCNEHDQCILREKRQIYPNIQSINNSNRIISKIYCIIVSIILISIKQN